MKVGKGDDVIEGKGTNDKEKILYIHLHFRYSVSVCKHFVLVVIQLCLQLRRYDLFFSGLWFAFDLFVSLRNSCSHWAQSWHTNMSRYWTSARFTPTTHTNTPTWGTVVDNSLYSRPDASMGIAVFALKQQNLFYGPCLTADLRWASLFQILTSATAVEIPALIPDQRLRLISPHWASARIENRQLGPRSGATLLSNGSDMVVYLAQMT